MRELAASIGEMPSPTQGTRKSAPTIQDRAGGLKRQTGEPRQVVGELETPIIGRAGSAPA